MKNKIVLFTTIFFIFSFITAICKVQANVVTLKNIIKPQDIEYEITIHFNEKLKEKELQQLIKQVERIYKIKAVRREGKSNFEFKIQIKQDYNKLKEKIKKENKNIVKVEVNPLLTNQSLKVQTNKLRVIYKKYVKDYQIKFLEKYYRLKQMSTPKKLSDKSLEVVYEVKQVPLLKAYNGLRKMGVVKYVRLVGEYFPFIAEPKGLPNLPKTYKEKGKEYKVVPFPNNPNSGYLEGLVVFEPNRELSDEELNTLLQKYGLKIIDKYKFSFKTVTSYEVEITPDKSTQEMIKILNNDPLIGEVRPVRISNATVD